MDNRGASLIISAIMLTAAIVIIVFTSYQWGSDVIESGKKSTDSMLAQKDLESLENAIRTVALEGKWSTRVVSVSSEFGFENNKTVMVYNNSRPGIKLDTPKITSCDRFILFGPDISVDEGKMTVISYSITFTQPEKHVAIKNAGAHEQQVVLPGGTEDITFDGYTYHNISRLDWYNINLTVS